MIFFSFLIKSRSFIFKGVTLQPSFTYPNCQYNNSCTSGLLISKTYNFLFLRLIMGKWNITNEIGPLYISTVIYCVLYLKQDLYLNWLYIELFKLVSSTWLLLSIKNKNNLLYWLNKELSLKFPMLTNATRRMAKRLW